MPIDFKLRFKHGEIARWAQRYKVETDAVIEDDNLRGYVKTHGHLSKDYLLKIAHWKSPRSAGRCKDNDEDFVRAVTATAFSTTNEKLRIEVLTLLCGVEWPTASVILHFCSIDKYPILDFRALWSLTMDVPKVYDFEFWRDYTRFCRRLAEETGVTMRDLDRALWQFSKESQWPTSRF
jgi:hypothetical protein